MQHLQKVPIKVTQDCYRQDVGQSILTIVRYKDHYRGCSANSAVNEPLEQQISYCPRGIKAVNARVMGLFLSK